MCQLTYRLFSERYTVSLCHVEAISTVCHTHTILCIQVNYKMDTPQSQSNGRDQGERDKESNWLLYNTFAEHFYKYIPFHHTPAQYFHKHNSHILYYEYTHKHTHSKLSICVTTHTDTHTWTTAHTEESRRQLMLCVHSQRVVLTVVDICWGATTCTHTAITEGAASLHTQSTGSRHKDT